MRESIGFCVFLLFVCISRTFSLPITRMRVCVQSNDPSRLQSQCVYCNNRSFVPTVRHCTGYAYLPANLSVEEAFCLVRTCRRQLPAIRPEPFYPNIQTPVENINSIPVNPNDDYTDSEALYSENHSSATTTTTSKRRPPASFSVGKPQRPGVRPLLFGK